MKFVKSTQRPNAILVSALLLLGAIMAGCRPAGSSQSTQEIPSGHAASAPLLLDDYSDAERNKNGAQRLLVDDKAAGSESRATVKCEDGVLTVTGELVPGRGVPAFISAVSLLSAEGKPKDMTGYEGVLVRVKVIKGMLCVQVATSTVTNFDFHASAPIAGMGGGFQEVRIPFQDMKRAWSEQTALDLASVTSVNLVSFGMARDAFAYEVDEIGFY